jgi:hypothetical protein
MVELECVCYPGKSEVFTLLAFLLVPEGGEAVLVPEPCIESARPPVHVGVHTMELILQPEETLTTVPV